MHQSRRLQRHDDRLIIHFDYDCFYASVVENEDPALKSVPLAIQQKQIVVTCNYEARRRGLHKLQLITEAKRICPEAVIILGEDLTRFRNASKDLYKYLQSSVWSGRAERLGFDEVWLDCTDMVDYNMGLLNQNDLTHSFFCLSKEDPTIGFEYDASKIYGPSYPSKPLPVELLNEQDQHLHRRLCLGSHLARHLRQELEEQKGYTATVGIATNKVLSKLVGNVNKPKNQTTLLPPYLPIGSPDNSINHFLDSHDIGKVPGIGFKLSHKVRSHVLQRPPEYDHGLVYGGTKESVKVLDVRSYPNMGPDLLEQILGGPGSVRGIGGKVWELIHGIDDTEVGKVKRVPSQISQEDSYMKYLDTFDKVKKQLQLLSERLIRRMHMDLLEEDDDDGDEGVTEAPEARRQLRWMAHPRTLRLTTRPRPPPGPDGIRPRTFQRISRSGPMPQYVFNLTESPKILGEKLVEDTLVPMFRKLHHETAGWNLSLINVAATNMAETAAESKDSEGRDIAKMFRYQDAVLKDFKVLEEEEEKDKEDMHTGPVVVASKKDNLANPKPVRRDSPFSVEEDGWESEDSATQMVERCGFCHSNVPVFALEAHQRYHELN
ncbi:hypothetical protein PV10_01834 [Exophiala mesophila]|uniref:UmuC domain-containing protein n=1 Tax=Exophiala mesophila TaxID=212818 RepID=A0A0D1ZVW9_EXOME|nr:uncharacterized protein PV10_01834 [Exophiala mesophila]KIV98154.1 hypothetical protein PV10_01834 [Exophiala mesophila]